MRALYSFCAVLLLGLFAYFGVAVWGLQDPLFGIVFPYAAFGIFVLGDGLPRSEMGPVPCPLRYRHDLRTAEVLALDQGQPDREPLLRR